MNMVVKHATQINRRDTNISNKEGTKKYALLGFKVPSSVAAA